MNVRTCN